MKAVLLLTMGSPQEPAKVPEFLFKLFSDRSIMDLPVVLRFPLAFMLSLCRTPKARAIYRQLGGTSPLTKETKKLALALEEKLRESGDYRCLIGTSYSTPTLAEAVAEAVKQGAAEYILLPLYPQYSRTTSGSALQEAEKVLRKTQKEALIKTILSFEEEKGFIQALVERIEQGLEQTKGSPKILLTAHGLPEKIVRKGDPYVGQCERTARAVCRKLEKKHLKIVLCYQSRVGPLKWIGPHTAQEIEKAGKERRPLIVAPLSFVSECSETAYEIDILFREKAKRAGCPSFIYTGTVGTDPAFIGSLAETVTKI